MIELTGLHTRTAVSNYGWFNNVVIMSCFSEQQSVFTVDVDFSVCQLRTEFFILFTRMDQHAGQNGNINLSNKSFGRVVKFKYLEKILTHQNFIHEKINNRLKSGSTCCNSVQNHLTSSLLSKI